MRSQSESDPLTTKEGAANATPSLQLLGDRLHGDGAETRRGGGSAARRRPSLHGGSTEAERPTSHRGDETHGSWTRSRVERRASLHGGELALHGDETAPERRFAEAELSAGIAPRRLDGTRPEAKLLFGERRFAETGLLETDREASVASRRRDEPSHKIF